MFAIAQLALTASLAVAQPSSAEVKSVFDYFYTGQGKGAVLADAVLCKTIEQKAKDTKYDCTEQFGNTAGKGDTINVYVTFLVPQGDTVETITVQAVHEGVVRETKDIALKGDFIRTRKWTSFSAKKPGKWEFRILDKDKVLKALSIEAS